MKLLKKVPERFKDLYRKYGWKAVAGIFLYYLVRDITIYVLIPLFLFKSVN